MCNIICMLGNTYIYMSTSLNYKFDRPQFSKVWLSSLPNHSTKALTSQTTPFRWPLFVPYCFAHQPHCILVSSLSQNLHEHKSTKYIFLGHVEEGEIGHLSCDLNHIRLFKVMMCSLMHSQSPKSIVHNGGGEGFFWSVSVIMTKMYKDVMETMMRM